MTKDKTMRIEIIGSGVVGQAVGKALHAVGYEVHFIDIQPNIVSLLQAEGYSASVPHEAPSADIYFICVSTPILNGEINYEPVQRACFDLGQRLSPNSYKLVVVKSTVLPGTTRNIIISNLTKISGLHVGKDFGVCVSPEYLRVKYSLSDAMNPKAIIIGQFDQKSGDTLVSLFNRFSTQIMRMTIEEAEFHKFVHNTFNATKIAFFNEMRIIAEKQQLDPEKIFQSVIVTCEGIWNPEYGTRNWGPFDGSCLTEDSQALLNWSTENQYDIGILDAVLRQNRNMKTNNA